MYAYGVQLHDFTPNAMLHIACFIVLCECFLGIHPHWGLWQHIFNVKCNAGPRGVYPVGGFGIQTRGDVGYFELKQLESVQNWRKKWFYVTNKHEPGQLYGVPKFQAGVMVAKKQSWSHQPDMREANEASML